MITNLSDALGRVHQSDCITGMKALPAESVQLVFADPPFNIGYEYDEYDDAMAADQYLNWSAQWMREVYRLLDPSGAFWLAIGDEYAAELKVQAQSIGFQMRSWVVWYYTFGVHCKTKFTRSHAHLFHFVKNAKHFTFNAADVAVPSARQLVYGDKRANPAGRMPDDTWILRPQDCVDGFTPDEDTWYFPRVAGTFKERAGFHGCQMPEQLLGRIVRTCSRPDDIVVDPFSGSCTTLAVAKKLGRRFFGFEMSKEYAKRGQQRIDAAGVGDALVGSEEPKVSAPATGADGSRRRKQTTDSGSGWTHPSLDFTEMVAESQGILEAFALSNRGYSVDRVVADPLLNEDFQTQCDRRSIPGTSAERNRFLFRLRKSGKLNQAEIPTQRRTSFTWEQMDPFLFASEIAWRRVSELYAGASLDEILCDPRLAEKFDSVAQGFAGGFSSLEYRWAALKLRKERAQIGVRRERTTPASLGLRKFKAEDLCSLKSLNLRDVTQHSGVYAIRMTQGPYLYAGETSNLKARLEIQLAEASRQSWPIGQRDDAALQIALLPVPTITDARLARQSRLLTWYHPEWNFHEQFAL